ncbi:hypothetical protein F4861DRAFT_544555 [Xylaria intraflava]|nr:hypothetical protein F4861DRAFT_544555 [Xylaria intraflava]
MAAQGNSQRSVGNTEPDVDGTVPNSAPEQGANTGAENEDDDTCHAIREAIADLVGKYGLEMVVEQSEEVANSCKRKRQYSSKSANYTDIVKIRLKEMELSARLSFFLHLNSSQTEPLHDYLMKQFKRESKDMRSWLSATANQRLRTNMNTWKYRVLDNLVNHVRALNKEDAEFKRAKNKVVASSIVQKKFNLESFAMVFDFVKGWIDLKSSLPPTEKYCKRMYFMSYYTQSGAAC